MQPEAPVAWSPRADTDTLQMSIWLERDSLNQLLSYSKHSLIRTCINRLKIGGERLSPYVWNGKPDPVWSKVNCHYGPKDLEQLREWADGNFEEITPTSRNSDWNVDRLSIVTKAKDAVDRLDFQKRMELESLDIDLLSNAFRELPNLSSLVFEASDRPSGIRDLAVSGFEVYDAGIPWQCHVFQVILQALSRAQCKPREIAWQNEWVGEGEEGLPIWAFNDITPLLIDQNQMVYLLSHLSVLRLQRIWGDGSYSMTLRFDDVVFNQALGHFVELCPQLEELHLEFEEDYSGFTRENLIGKALGVKLRILTLQHMSIDSFQLALCITANKSLEKVRLVSIYLTDCDWMSFLDHVKADCPPSLTSFEVDRNTIGEYHDDLIEDYVRNVELEFDTEGDYLLEYIQGKTSQDSSSPE